MNELTQDDLHRLVQSFYTKVRQDPLLSPIFNDVAQVDWEHHLPLLTQFWSNVMLGSSEYKGGAFAKHVMLGQKTTITEQHFTRWLSLFEAEAKSVLHEPYASTIIERAHLVARSLKMGMGLA
jgi:hemoglobin